MHSLRNRSYVFSASGRSLPKDALRHSGQSVLDQGTAVPNITRHDLYGSGEQAQRHLALQDAIDLCRRAASCAAVAAGTDSPLLNGIAAQLQSLLAQLEALR
jgi:hypothetical protein